MRSILYRLLVARAIFETREILSLRAEPHDIVVARAISLTTSEHNLTSPVILSLLARSVTAREDNVDLIFWLNNQPVVGCIPGREGGVIWRMMTMATTMAREGGCEEVMTSSRHS